MISIDSILNKALYQENIAILGTSRSVRIFPQDFDGIKIAVGDLPFRAPEFGPFDFHISANNVWPDFTNSKFVESFLNLPVKTFIFSTANFSRMDRGQIKNFLFKLENFNSKRFIFFDQRHFDNNACPQLNGCCIAYNELKLTETLQTLVAKEFGLQNYYAGSHSVFFHALALSFLLRPKNIVTFGIDLPFSNFRYKHFKPWKFPTINRTDYLRVLISRKSFFLVGKDEIFSDLNYFSNLQSFSKSKLYYTNRLSTLSQIHGIDFWE
jgi:hypothetical protein